MTPICTSDMLCLLRSARTFWRVPYVTYSAQCSAHLAAESPSDFGVAGFSALAAKAGVGRTVTFPLAQTGEGIHECELVSWFVKARALVACKPLEPVKR